VAAFVAGLIAAANGGDETAGSRFAAAWQDGRIDAMYAELSPRSRADVSPVEFRRAYERTARTATAVGVRAEPGGKVESGGSAVEVLRAVVDTRAFGEVSGEIGLPTDDEGIAWEPHMAFPGLEAGERLTRRTRVGERAPILAADGSVLAEGPADARSLPIGPAAAAVVGEVGSPAPAGTRELEARGFPPGALAGISGLELAYDERLAGSPGGELLASSEGADDGEPRLLARTRPVDGRPVRTTIDAELQEAAVGALGALYGGVAVLDARRGSVRALGGIAFTAPQPPGSTFKVVTTVGALESEVVALDDEFPVESSNSDIGREISNSNDQACGGTFAESFANSCNTVFAPVGAELGGRSLVDVAERFGFNTAPTLHGAEATAAIDPPASTIPTDLSDEIEVGVTAIGQGEVLATPLQMASIAQTIANGGLRAPTLMVKGDLVPEDEDIDDVRVTSRPIANTVRDLMVDVVDSGTGTAAALPNAQVAGKTGTAELGPAPLEPGEELAPGETPAQELDAWFIAFAPARDPELAVAVMIVGSEGDGGTIAAPIARQVLEAGLG